MVRLSLTKNPNPRGEDGQQDRRWRSARRFPDLDLPLSPARATFRRYPPPLWDIRG